MGYNSVADYTADYIIFIPLAMSSILVSIERACAASY